jgi:hypothetical protein
MAKSQYQYQARFITIWDPPPAQPEEVSRGDGMLTNGAAEDDVSTDMKTPDGDDLKLVNAWKGPRRVTFSEVIGAGDRC